MCVLCAAAVFAVELFAHAMTASLLAKIKLHHNSQVAYMKQQYFCTYSISCSNSQTALERYAAASSNHHCYWNDILMRACKSHQLQSGLQQPQHGCEPLMSQSAVIVQLTSGYCLSSVYATKLKGICDTQPVSQLQPCM